jgi:hypothetical protein
MNSGRELVAFFDGGHVRESEFLDEAILKRAVHAFDAALSLA